jgi:hypothetical protein
VHVDWVVWLRKIALVAGAGVSFVGSGTLALAGGPKYVAGTSFFNPGVVGQPIRWVGGRVNYFVDQGPLNSSIDNQQATAMVDAAAALWSGVSTAGVTLVDAGTLNEDVSGSNLAVTNGLLAAPTDVTEGASAYPVGVIFDADGSVIDALYGTNASQPESCENNGVFAWIDGFSPDARITHAIILVNGRCATSASLLVMMNFELARAFGQVLGLDFAQVNPGPGPSDLPGWAEGWPVMQPISGGCGASGGSCLPDPLALRFDDIAALNRMYPVTAQNAGAFPGKQITAANTVTIQGTISFKSGYGMQGVNVVARPLDADGNPLYQYTVSAVSGEYFSGNHGNPVTGFTDAQGNALSEWGSEDPALQGYFDLSDMPLPPGMTTANFQVTFEPINPLFILANSVGPYALGQGTPSGTMPMVVIPALTAGSTQTVAVTADDSAAGGYEDAIGTAAEPRSLPLSGFWTGRLSQVGQTDWFSFPVRGNRLFTIVTQALDAHGAPTNSKAMASIGVWDGFEPVGSMAIGSIPGMNGTATGETWLRVSAAGDDIVRVGIADRRGDGRPDYLYTGWVLYADSILPQHLPASGGPFVIHGMGFRAGDTVLVNGVPAAVTSLSASEITAIAPPAGPGVTGSVDVEVDDLPGFHAATIVAGGLSYNAGTGDALTLNSAPMNTVPIGVPLPFSVTALGPDLAPASGVTVIYTVTSGTAKLGCGVPVCGVTATGDGRATINITAVDATWSIVTASLTNGSSVQAQFAGGTAPTLASLTPRLSLAAGATVTWTVQALVLANGRPAAGQAVTWQTGVSGLMAENSAAITTDANGIATQQIVAGPLSGGEVASINACVNGTSQCVAFTAIGARPELASLSAISGTNQSISATGTPSQVVLRLLDTDGNPMAGGTVAYFQALYAWAPPCAVHGVCPPSVLLATQVSTAASALDGTVAFSPAALPGVATTLQGLAASGNTSTVAITIEQHP